VETILGFSTDHGVESGWELVNVSLLKVESVARKGSSSRVFASALISLYRRI